LTSPTGASHSAVIWQGYHHAWEYNHRINRFGSYVDHRPGDPSDGALQATVGHTAASGTGNDTAHFVDFCTTIQSAEGVAFQAGCEETVVECQRGDLTPFTIEVDGLELAPEMQGRQVYAVVLNGFDIYALEHAEKIITFDMDVTEPAIYEGGTKVRFYVVGRLCFDCRSPECQLLPLRLESEPVDKPDEDGQDDDQGEVDVPELPPVRKKRGLDRRKFDRAVNWLKRQLATLMGVEELKRSLVGEDTDSPRRRLFRILGRRFYLRFLKWELSAPYMVRVRFLLIGGDRDALAVRDSDFYAHEYSWDLENEIHHEEVGVLPVAVQADDVEGYAVNTLAFSRMSMDVEIDKDQGTEDFVQWGRGMHLLEWSMAIRDIEPGPDGIRAKLDLFYKNWSEAMNRVITITTWGAVRGAGSARIGARLKLLQFKRATTEGQLAMPGRIYWPGGGLSAAGDPRARFERPVGALALAEET
jgi:hypothetical protein